MAFSAICFGLSTFFATDLPETNVGRRISPVKDTHEDGSNMSLAEFLSIEYVSAVSLSRQISDPALTGKTQSYPTLFGDAAFVLASSRFCPSSPSIASLASFVPMR
jgi:hypothetical protein